MVKIGIHVTSSGILSPAGSKPGRRTVTSGWRGRSACVSTSLHEGTHLTHISSNLMVIDDGEWVQQWMMDVEVKDSLCNVNKA